MILFEFLMLLPEVAVALVFTPSTPRLCVLPTKCFLPPPSLPARRFCSDLLHRPLFLLLRSAPSCFSRFCLSFYGTQVSLFIAGISETFFFFFYFFRTTSSLFPCLVMGALTVCLIAFD